MRLVMFRIGYWSRLVDMLDTAVNGENWHKSSLGQVPWYIWCCSFICMPSMSISTEVILSSVCPSVCVYLCAWLYTNSLWSWYLTNCLWEFWQIYNLGAVGDKDELFSFWDQKVKGQGHSKGKSGQKHTFEFWRSCIQRSLSQATCLMKTYRFTVCHRRHLIHICR